MKLSLFVQDSSTHGRANRPRRGHATGGSVAALVAMLLLGASRTAFASGQGEDAGVFFERYVRPPLRGRCYECHWKQARKLRGGLDLEHGKVGKTGAIAAGDRARQPGHQPPDPGGPLPGRRSADAPKGKLPDREIAVLTRWVAMGAPDPRRGDAPKPATPGSTSSGATFWAFQPPAEPERPKSGTLPGQDAAGPVRPGRAGAERDCGPRRRRTSGR